MKLINFSDNVAVYRDPTSDLRYVVRVSEAANTKYVYVNSLVAAAQKALEHVAHKRPWHRLVAAALRVFS